MESPLKKDRDAGCLNEESNLFGFIGDHTFLTKNGDLGVMLGMRGVDYECLTANEIDQFTKCLESAFKIFDGKCRVYQYLFKRNHETIPYRTHENPIINTAIESRLAYLKSKADSLYSLTIYYVVLLEVSHSKKALRVFTDGKDRKRTWNELLALLSTNQQVVMLDEEIARLQAQRH